MTAAPPDLVLRAERVFDGETMLQDRAVVVRGERIVDLTADPPSCPRTVRLPSGALLAPGVIDVQVNGGGGVLLNDDPSPAGIARIAAAHRFGGTTALLPTLISDTRDAIRAAVADWLAASRFADRIAAVRTAHPRHGGAGALYVVLRRARNATGS